MNPNVSVFVVFVILGSALGLTTLEEFKAAWQKCVKETGIDPHLILRPRQVDASIDDRRKCFYACVLYQRNVLREDGYIDVDLAISEVPENMPEKERFIASITDCAAKKGANDCETAYEFHMCIHEKAPYLNHHH